MSQTHVRTTNRICIKLYIVFLSLPHYYNIKEKKTQSCLKFLLILHP